MFYRSDQISCHLEYLNNSTQEVFPVIKISKHDILCLHNLVHIIIMNLGFYIHLLFVKL